MESQSDRFTSAQRQRSSHIPGKASEVTAASRASRNAQGVGEFCTSLPWRHGTHAPRNGLKKAVGQIATQIILRLISI